MAFIKFQGRQIGWDNEVPVIDTISEMDVKITGRYGTSCLNEYGEEIPFEDLKTGVLYWDAYLRTNNIYVVELAPFETQVRIVDRTQKTFVLEDVSPDKELHVGFVPLYHVYPSYFLPMLKGANMVDGVFEGRFTFKNVGSVTSLALA